MAGHFVFNWCSPCKNGRHLGRNHEGRYCECRCKTVENADKREET